MVWRQLDNNSEGGDSITALSENKKVAPNAAAQTHPTDSKKRSSDKVTAKAIGKSQGGSPAKVTAKATGKSQGGKRNIEAKLVHEGS